MQQIIIDKKNLKKQQWTFSFISIKNFSFHNFYLTCISEIIINKISILTIDSTNSFQKNFKIKFSNFISFIFFLFFFSIFIFFLLFFFSIFITRISIFSNIQFSFILFNYFNRLLINFHKFSTHILHQFETFVFRCTKIDFVKFLNEMRKNFDKKNEIDEIENNQNEMQILMRKKLKFTWLLKKKKFEIDIVTW